MTVGLLVVLGALVPATVRGGATYAYDASLAARAQALVSEADVGVAPPARRFESGPGLTIVSNPEPIYDASVSFDATNTATELADDAVTTVGTKISGQMGSRGWTQSLIDDTLARPSSTVITRDTRWTSAGTRLNDPATAFIRADGSYVVRNDLTGDVVQISNRNDPNWIAPWD